MFTDISGYTALMQQNEAEAILWRNRHRSAFENFHQKYRGEIVQYFGDGTLSVFTSSVNAVECAIALQQELRKDPVVPLRIGIHSGDIIKSDYEIIGDGVNIASRIESLAVAGSILISEVVKSQIANHDFSLLRLGDFSLKNVVHPVPIYAVQADDLVVPDSLVASPQAAKTSSENKSIAILPFVNMSNDEEQEYFCDGMTEELINSLSSLDDLKVIARTSVFMFKNKNEDVRQIARKLNVSTVLEGSVRKFANRLRISSQLIDARDGSRVWSDRYDRELKDVFEIQEEISLAIVDALKIKLLGNEEKYLTSGPTANVEAYNLYLKGQFEWYKRNRVGMLKSIDLFKQALRLDPRYTLAKVGIAFAYIAMCDWGELTAAESLPKAKSILDEIIAKEEHLAEVYAAMSYHDLCNWDLKGYQVNYEKAIELNPKYSFSHHLHTVANSVLGTFDIGIQSNAKARRLDPLSVIFNFSLGFVRFFSGKYEVAVDQFRYILSLDPQFKPAALFGFYNLVVLDEFDKALTMLQAMFEQDSQGQEMRSQAEQVYLKKGIEGLLRWLIDEGLSYYGRPMNRAYHRATCYALLNDSDQTFSLLQSLYEIRSFRLLFFRFDPIIARFRDDPRYRRLEDDIGIWKK